MQAIYMKFPVMVTAMPVAMMILVFFAQCNTALGMMFSLWKPLYEILGDNIHTDVIVDSKPGTPKLSDWKGKPLLDDIELWRVKLAERLMKATAATEAMEKCGSFLSFGDYTWCRKAVPQESRELLFAYERIQEYVVNSNITAPSTNPDDFLGLSFGIRTSDAWSELMSSLFFVRTQLYDCYYAGNEGPMAFDLHEGHSKNKPCRQRHCYTTEYEIKRICIDDTPSTKGLYIAKNNRTYEPLSMVLKGRANLSTFVKMDVEGSEWATLEGLVQNEEDIAKIRTLDLEVHFHLDATPNGNNVITKDTLERHVKVMERLADKFAVTGSTIETYLNKIIRNYKRKRMQNSSFVEDFTHLIYTEGGLILHQYCISFVNRKLL